MLPEQAPNSEISPPPHFCLVLPREAHSLKNVFAQNSPVKSNQIDPKCTTPCDFKNQVFETNKLY